VKVENSSPNRPSRLTVLISVLVLCACGPASPNTSRPQHPSNESEPLASAPCRTIDGPKTGLNHPARGLALFGDGALAISDASGEVYVFDRRSTGDISPIASIHLTGNSGRQIALAADTDSSRLYVGNVGLNRIDVYQRHGGIHLDHFGALQGNLTRLDGPVSLALDSLGNLYVINLAGEPSVLVFKHGSIGNTAPIRTINGPATRMFSPGGIAASEHGEIFISNDRHYPSPFTITIYSPSATGNSKPIRVLSAKDDNVDSLLSGNNYGRSQLNDPLGLSIFDDKYLIVANAGASVIGISRRGQRVELDAVTPPITAYNLEDSGDASPAWSINGTLTELAAPLAVASDRAGNIYVQNSLSPSVVEFCAIAR
jgi:DNA-binding beta-propeller fold protein YncE